MDKERQVFQAELKDVGTVVAVKVKNTVKGKQNYLTRVCYCCSGFITSFVDCKDFHIYEIGRIGM